MRLLSEVKARNACLWQVSTLSGYGRDTSGSCSLKTQVTVIFSGYTRKWSQMTTKQIESQVRGAIPQGGEAFGGGYGGNCTKSATAKVGLQINDKLSDIQANRFRLIQPFV